MPTPESAAFLAKKPTVPPTFEGVDYDDNKRLKQAQDSVVREQWVQVMMGRLVREELGKCYYREGVNHLEKCGPLRDAQGPQEKHAVSDIQQYEHRFGEEAYVLRYSISKTVSRLRAATGIGQSALEAPTPYKILELEPVPQSITYLHSQHRELPTALHVPSTVLSEITVMICRRCLQRASALRTPRAAPNTSISWSLPVRNSSRPISSTATRPSAAAAPATATSTIPPLSTPLADSEGGATAAKESLSSCPEGTILKGLNYFKNKTDPVALADDAYPEWLWKCLEVQQKTEEGESDDAGDEFSKSKKQRRLAAKRQRTTEAKMLAEGNLEALAPKIPLQHQSINLPANESSTIEGAVAAHDAREDLRRAMRRERKAKIKESNYLKSM
ncbi:hypothetical protein FHL15_002481 [Xylaria flabelliformis]|uniref:Large ribosomal subunit protein mL54 n=1 Tax=Xylaria flabelliformis TaxID=2512241 RepID=A0A553I8P7_9PEZI|nr:hypothetical protein FHL15_002481 [Xylaria flabelliformis]